MKAIIKALGALLAYMAWGVWLVAGWHFIAPEKWQWLIEPKLWGMLFFGFLCWLLATGMTKICEHLESE